MSFVTTKSLPRRAMLRGMGAALALPFLDAMVPALVGAELKPARRLGFVYMPNGVAKNHEWDRWTPSGVGASFEFSSILAPMAPLRDRLVVISGLSQMEANAAGDGNGDHTRGTATWLSGVRPKWTEGADVQAATTVDQIAATRLGADTPLPSIEVGIDSNYRMGSCENGYSCVYMNTLAWRTPTTPLPVENNPRVLFERLFGEGGTTAQRVRQMRRNRSILDSVLSEIADLQRTLGAGDRATVGDYVESVREVERRIQRAEAQSDQGALPDLDRPLGVPDRFDEHVRLMFDLQLLAFRADLTRVSTFMLGREVNSRIFPEIGITEPHHGLSHHGNRQEPFEKYAKINTYFTQLAADFFEKLRSTPEGDANLLDNSLFLFGGALGNGNEHAHHDLPVVVLGGGDRLKGGRHLVVPPRTPMTNLLLSLLDKIDHPLDNLGDSTGTLNLLAGV
jgi:hypothetical protein